MPLACRYEQPYEALKAATRGKEINRETMTAFIHTLKVSDEVKAELLRITPQSFNGYCDISKYYADKEAK